MPNDFAAQPNQTNAPATGADLASQTSGATIATDSPTDSALAASSVHETASELPVSSDAGITPPISNGSVAEGAQQFSSPTAPSADPASHLSATPSGWYLIQGNNAKEVQDFKAPFDDRIAAQKQIIIDAENEIRSIVKEANQAISDKLREITGTSGENQMGVVTDFADTGCLFAREVEPQNFGLPEGLEM